MNHEHPTPNMTDQELDAVLKLATVPKLPLGAKGRLLAKLGETKDMVATATTEPQSSRLGWLAGIPLAASLAFGLYIGSAGLEGSVLPSFAQELLADTTLDDTYSGIEDVEALTEENVS
jgi:hypothetical protein